METDKFSLRFRLKSFKYAFAGIFMLIKHEHNARIHLIAALTAILAGIILKINCFEWCLIVTVIGFVFFAELVNTGIETLADAVNPEYDENIKKIKDYSAAAVLVAALVAIITGGIIFIPKIFELIN